MSWQALAVSSCATHHVDEHGNPAYPDRFDEVLKFHAPGRAPVVRAGQAWHIQGDGSPAYDRRFIRTFGYYEGLAAVAAPDGWHHITPDGREAYAHRHAWCGNFQQGRCTVRDQDGAYFHITAAGEAAYRTRWRYAGDYRDSLAVVQAADGRSTHIRLDGALLHGRWFLDLDVFHKGFARARDDFGWMHVDVHGRPVYERRFAAVEPFYNGQGRVERFDGGLEVIDERGNCLIELRPTPRIVSHTPGRVLARTAWGCVRCIEGPGAPPQVVKWTRGSNDREVEVLRALQGHPSVPKLLGRQRCDMNDQLVLSCCAGDVAGDPHPRRHPVSEAIRITRDVLSVCEAMHQEGWVHTDIHPGNVLVGEPAILLDYACAVRASYDIAWRGEINWGVWAYAPPEQLVDFGELDPAADVYAAASLCVALIRGGPPFQVPRPSQESPVDWVAVRDAMAAARKTLDLGDLEASLRRALMPALSPNRGDRPTARRLAEALENV